MPTGWHYSYAGLARAALRRRRDPGHWRAARTVARSFELPDLRVVRRRRDEIWALFLVKNEVDILGHTFAHTLDQGVDRILVVDNGSTDGTLDLLQHWAAKTEGRVLVGRDHEVAYYQSEKMTHLARWASWRGAGWILPVDADEFWFSETHSTVGEHLRNTSDDIVEAALYNVFPTPMCPVLVGLQQGPVRFDHHRHILPKLALRGSRVAWLGMGNHTGLRHGMRGGGLSIVHVPWRSREQYAAKVRQGAAALAASTLDGHLGSHWREHGTLSDERIAAVWEGLLAARAPQDLGWSPHGPFTVTDPTAWPRGRWPVPSFGIDTRDCDS